MESPLSFETVSDATISKLIRSAVRRVVLVTPAVSLDVANAVENRWRALGPEAVTVVTDVSEAPYRLGFGEPAGLKALTDAANHLNADVCTREGVRLGLVIADEQTLLFTPTALAVEGFPPPNAPNGLLLHSRNAAIGRGIEDASAMVASRKVDEVSVRRVTKALELTPPKQFDVSRTELVFNSAIEFVEFELKGAELQKKTAALPADLLRIFPIEHSDSLLHATFKLLGKDDLSSGFDELRSAKQEIAKKFLVVLPKHGTVIRRQDKKAFTEAITSLRKSIEAFSKVKQQQMEASMAANRKRLVDGLLPSVLKTKPDRWARYAQDEATVRRLLDRELTRAFGTVEDLLRALRLDVRFKGVTYEMLQDPNFQNAAQKGLPELEFLHDEHEAARAALRDSELDFAGVDDERRER